MRREHSENPLQNSWFDKKRDRLIKQSFGKSTKWTLMGGALSTEDDVAGVIILENVFYFDQTISNICFLWTSLYLKMKHTMSLISRNNFENFWVIKNSHFGPKHDVLAQNLDLGPWKGANHDVLSKN